VVTFERVILANEELSVSKLVHKSIILVGTFLLFLYLYALSFYLETLLLTKEFSREIAENPIDLLNSVFNLFFLG